MLKVLLCVAAVAFLQIEGRHRAAADNGNFLDDKQWLTTVSQYDKEPGHWNKFRDVCTCLLFVFFCAALRGMFGRGEAVCVRERERAGGSGRPPSLPSSLPSFPPALSSLNSGRPTPSLSHLAWPRCLQTPNISEGWDLSFNFIFRVCVVGGRFESDFARFRNPERILFYE